MKDNHRICSKHFVSERPSKDPNDVDYIPTVFTDAKRRTNVVKLDTKRSDRALKRRKAVDEVNDTAAMYIDQFIDFLAGLKP